MTAVPAIAAPVIDAGALKAELERAISGEVRFDAISRALYSTDASVYQIQPIGVTVPKNRGDILRILEICARFRCPITMRGGGTSQGRRTLGLTPARERRARLVQACSRMVACESGISDAPAIR